MRLPQVHVLNRSRLLLPSQKKVVTRCFSSFSDQPFDFRVSRLGLTPTFILPTLETLQQLPELNHAVQVLQAKVKPTATTDSDLDRASQVLESVGPKEFQASIAVRAELQQRLGQHSKAYDTVCQLEELVKQDKHASMDVLLAKAKTAWYKGQFDVTEQICYDLLEADDIHAMPLHYASALSGYGLGKLIPSNKLDDAYTVRDPTRMALKYLEKYSHPLALTTAHLNMGVAELLYGQVIRKERKARVPVDAALRMWSEGLTLLERRKPKSTLDQAITDALLVRLHTNMAMGILQIDDGMEDIIPESSEHAGKALKCSDKNTEMPNEEKEFLRRILTILGTCYHQAGKAVTAEGLFQTATSLPAIGCTLTTLDRKSAFEGYSQLCKEWEKREGDAAKQQQKADDADKKLPESWRGKSGVSSSLWFWTPGEFKF